MLAELLSPFKWLPPQSTCIDINYSHYYLVGFFLHYFLSITVADPASEICSREEVLLKLSELLPVEIPFQWSYSLRNMFHESLRCCGRMLRKGPQKSLD